MQNHAVCLLCCEPIPGDPVYEAPCGDDGCPSAVWHPACLMEWRDMGGEAAEEEVRTFVQTMADMAAEFQRKILGQ